MNLICPVPLYKYHIQANATNRIFVVRMAQLLSEIADGQEVKVISIASSVLRVKLLEMGLLEDQPIRVLFRAPLGDPMAIDVNGYVLSLRLSEARLVSVTSKADSV